MTEIAMLEDMLKLQAEYDELVFEAYGMKGYEDIGLDSLQAALLDECGELNHELKKNWCWWKKTQSPIDSEKVLEELADVMHFVLMSVHWMKADGEEIDDFFTGWQYAQEKIKKAYKPDKPSKCLIELLRDHDTKNIWGIGFDLYWLIYSLDLTLEQAYEAYKKKNAINRQRVRDGY